MGILQVTVAGVIIADSRITYIATTAITTAIEGQGGVTAHPVFALYRLYVPARAVPVGIFQVTVGGVVIADSRIT